MGLKGLNEFGLIELITGGIKAGDSVLKGIGDDAAVIRWKGQKALLFASDMTIEGVHFDPGKAAAYRIGWKALAVNISDIAAMGGVPRYAVVSLGLPGERGVRFAAGFYSGLKSIARRFDVNIVGGDLSSSGMIVVDVAIIGEADRKKVAYRSGAKAGDIIIVTGRLGGSIKGRHLRFMPRVKEAHFLATNFKINAMIDISDGLSSDLARICRASRVGAEIYESLIPASPGSSLKDALNGGEDFELLFTVSRKYCRPLLEAFRKKFRVPVTPVGGITGDGRIRMVDRYGRAAALKEGGFSHF